MQRSAVFGLSLGDGGMHLNFHRCSQGLFVLEVVGGGK